MQDHSPKHQSENLPRYQWSSFFADLLDSRKHQLVSVLQGGDLLLLEPDEDTAPLLGIDYTSAHKGTIAITTGGDKAETTTISAPNIVWVVRDPDRTVVALEIIDEKDHKVNLRFA